MTYDCPVHMKVPFWDSEETENTLANLFFLQKRKQKSGDLPRVHTVSQ